LRRLGKSEILKLLVWTTTGSEAVSDTLIPITTLLSIALNLLFLR